MGEVFKCAGSVRNKSKITKMVDWKGLFEWSLQYNDGTKPSEFKEMSKEDREFLEGALKEYTFNDTDRMKELCKELKERKNEIQPEEMSVKLDEVQELCEIHERSNYNFCLIGGMQTIMNIMTGYPDIECRK